MLYNLRSEGCEGLWNGVFWVLIHSKQLSDRDLFSREEYEWKN